MRGRITLGAALWLHAAQSLAEESPAPGPVTEPAPVTEPVPVPEPLPVTPPAAIVVDVHGPARRRDPRASSAEAVTSLALTELRRGSGDVGHALVRSSGVNVRREGGLGSTTRIALAGLTDERVPVFVDGVPIEVAGYPFGIANVPLSLLERIDVYRGVVPVRFGADALGGAIDLVTERSPRGTSGLVSYQAGSFDTHRLAGTARSYHGRYGLYVRADAFYDTTRNDYPIRVTVPAAIDNRSVRTTVDKRHDAYRAGGGTLELGVQNRPWARRLLVRGFYGGLHKDVAHNLTMTQPYGLVYEERSARGALARYESPEVRDLSVSATLGYTQRRVHFDDTGTCTVDWYGRCTRSLLPSGGEIADRPYDQRIRQHSVFARASLRYAPSPWAELLLSSTLIAARRTGFDAALPSASTDPLEGKRELMTLVSGLEHKLVAWDARLENTLFAKSYVQRARSDQVAPAGGYVRLNQSHERLGVGDGLRVRIVEGLDAKASYEWATRFPSPDQLFGNGALIEANLTLRPESSHNLNLGASMNQRWPSTGTFEAGLNGFLRASDELIVLLPSPRFSVFQNVATTTTRGVELSYAWTSPGGLLHVDGNLTWQNAENRSRDGLFARYRGDRIPYQPYLFAHLASVLTWRGLVVDGDVVTLGYQGHYVRAFDLGWESLGGQKLSVPDQLVHTLSTGLSVERTRRVMSATLELHNLSDARVYDYFGVQRPGRSVFAKWTIEM
jgi:vitamin B12 transporter